MEESDRLPRKLAAILYADVAGYSRLTGADEDATHRRLSDCLDLISRSVEQHRGRVVHYAGDAVLAMFDAAVDVLACATRIQRELERRNEDQPGEQKLQFRIGVNIGDVIEDRGDIYGEGVNVAARLEGLAEPGDICISESVRTAVGTTLPLEYEFMGERAVKNIADPVRAYRVQPAKLGGGRRSSTAVGASKSTGSTGALYTPSVAVLPFNAIGDDPEDQHLADGITDNIINTLSRSEHFMVPDRTSLFAYKEKSPRPAEVADALGVEHVLEGGVQRVGDQARITIHLVDAATGHQTWSDRVDRRIEDVFALQDDLAQHVAMALRVLLVFGEAGRKTDHGVSLDASVLTMRTTVYLLKNTREAVARARSLSDEIMRLEPEFAIGPVNAAWAHWHEGYYGWSAAPEASLETAMKYARRAIDLDPDYAEAWVLLGQIQLTREEYEQAISSGEKALALTPNDPFNAAMYAWILNYSGDAERAFSLITEAIRLFPQCPDFVYRTLGVSHHLGGRLDEALDAHTRAISLSGGDRTFCLAYQAVVLGELGRAEEARVKTAEALALTPDLSLAKLRYLTGFRDPAERERFRTALLRAGLPYY